MAIVFEYSSVSVIGSFCEAAHQLRRGARDVVSGPLDWVFADRLAILACVESDFEGLCQWENLVLTADLLRIQDRLFGVDFFHQFPRDPEGRIQPYALREARKAYLPRLAHLVENYRAIVGRHLFVWVVDRRKLRAATARDAAYQVLQALRQRKPECELLVVQSDTPVDRPWGFGTINRYTSPTPGEWQGDDAGWNAIFAELGIERRGPAAQAQQSAAHAHQSTGVAA